MASYNGERFIHQQIESILIQIGESDELVISDDGSLDNTVEIIRSFDDPRIKLFSNEGEKGYVGNFLNAVNNSIGDIVYFSDQDDVWHPDKIADTVFFFDLYDMVVHDSIIVDENLCIVKDSYFDFRGTRQGFFKNFLKFGYLGCQVAFKRSLYKSSLPFPPRYDLVTHDAWICLFAEFGFKVKLVKKPLILYRRHDSNASKGGHSSISDIWKKVLIRVYVLYFILKRSSKRGR